MFQETKCGEGLCESASFLRISSPADSHWGTAVWFNKIEGALTIQGQQLVIGEDDIVILCAEPRLLALQVTKQAFRFVVLAGHCPHSGRQQERTDFMKPAPLPLTEHLPDGGHHWRSRRQCQATAVICASHR